MFERHSIYTPRDSKEIAVTLVVKHRKEQEIDVLTGGRHCRLGRLSQLCSATRRDIVHAGAIRKHDFDRPAIAPAPVPVVRVVVAAGDSRVQQGYFSVRESESESSCASVKTLPPPFIHEIWEPGMRLYVLLFECCLIFLLLAFIGRLAIFRAEGGPRVVRRS